MVGVQNIMVKLTEEETDRLKEVMVNFLSTSTSHALPRLTSEGKVWRKLFWLVIFVVVLVSMVFVLGRLMKRYFDYPILTSTEIVRSHHVVFPAITVCNENILRKSKIKHDPFFDDLAALEEHYRRGTANLASSALKVHMLKNLQSKHRHRRNIANRSGSDTSSKSDWTTTRYGDMASMIQNSATTDLSDVSEWYRPTYDEVTRYGHQKNDMIIQCSFDGQQCDERDFDKFVTSKTGNCFTFNSKLMNTSRQLRTTNSIGYLHGLRLTLNIEVDEYIGILEQEVGARIAIHHNDVFPFMGDVAVGAPPGMATQIGVKKIQVNRQKYPYRSNCTDSQSHHHFPGLYTEAACLASNFRDLTFARCGCHTDAIFADDMLCGLLTLTNTTTAKCVGNVTSEFNQHIDDVTLCQPVCNETDYDVGISMIKWPSTSYLDYMNDESKLKQWSFNSSNSEQFSTRLSENLVRVQVYISSRDVVIITESPSFSWEDIVAQIGGLLGLFIGVSVCTMFEVVELMFDILLVVLPTVCSRPKQQQDDYHNIEEGHRPS